MSNPHTSADLSGLTVGQLLVIRRDGKMRDGHIAWLCLCVCTKTKRISSNSLRRKSPVRSCGCLNGSTAAKKRAGLTPWNDSKSYLVEGGTRCYKTRHGWAKAAIKYYGNRCERCGWDESRCDVHHRVQKSQGGPHTIANAIVICPNCHRIQHSH